MPSTESINVSLLENSHAFICQAVSKAISAQDNVRDWQFALLSLVQSAELSLKVALKDIHPVLLYENVDKPSRLVTLRTALDRLENPLIGAFIFTNRDKVRINRANRLRNEMTHSYFVLSSEYAAANFFELFAFISDFQRHHLSSDLSKVIPADDFDKLIGIRKAIDELVRRARERIVDDEIDLECIWRCPSCGEDTFIIEDGADVCYACSYTDQVLECPQCGHFCFECDLESFFDEIDADREEGRTIIRNSYGYSDFAACSMCLPAIKMAIQEQREEEEMYRLEEEYYRRKA